MVDPTLLVALNELATQQAKPQEIILPKLKMLLDYDATYPNATIRYLASDMALCIDSDAAYLVILFAKSRMTGHYYLSFHPSTPSPLQNGPILTECKALRHVVGSAAEAETGGLYHNGQTAIPIRIALEELGHPQPPTHSSLICVYADNSLGVWERVGDSYVRCRCLFEYKLCYLVTRLDSYW